MNQEVVAYAKLFVGKPYIWGGSGPIGFDCSGFAQEVLSAFGMDPPGDQSAQGLHDHYVRQENGEQSQIGPGALVFYGKSEREISHVALMISSWQAIGANGGDATCTDAASASKKAAFIKIRPLKYRKDIVAVIMPRYREE